jgi:CRISPR-associated protein Cmr3
MKNLQTYSLAITPCDTLFFRNGSPFGMGDETWAESSLLPNPSVLWGALFTHLLHSGILSLSETKSLAIKDIYLANVSGNDVTKAFIPAPADLFERTSSGMPVSDNVVSIEAWGVLSSLPAALTALVMVDENENADAPDDKWIHYNHLFQHYPTRDDKTVWESKVNIAMPSPKIGFERNDALRNVEEGRLYRIEMSEMNKNFVIIVEFDAPTGLPDQGLLRLGGEGKMASYNTVQFGKATQVNAPSGKFKMYVQTPAFFESGDGTTELGSISGIHLSAACIGKPQQVGGFDMVLSTPKPMRKAIPPGSVYHFEGQFNDVVKNAILDQFNPDDTDKGFNIVHFLHE